MRKNDQKHLATRSDDRAMFSARWGCAVVLALIVVSSVSAGQEHEVPGARPATRKPGVSESGSPGSQLSYFGIMGAVKSPAVYSSPSGAVSLTDLVECAGGLEEGGTQTAHIVRDGHAGLRVFWTPQSKERLLPGDLVIFPGRHSTERSPVDAVQKTVASVEVDTVTVAFLGLIDRRPVIVPLDVKYATVPDVLSALLLPERASHAVRVINADPLQAAPRGVRASQRLIHGDVLVFDRSLLSDADMAAIARTQMSPETAFPVAIPLSSRKPDTGTQILADESTLPRIVANSTDGSRNPEVSPTLLTAPQFVDVPLPGDSRETTDQVTSGPTGVSADEVAEESVVWDLTEAAGVVPVKNQMMDAPLGRSVDLGGSPKATEEFQEDAHAPTLAAMIRPTDLLAAETGILPAGDLHSPARTGSISRVQQADAIRQSPAPAPQTSPASTSPGLPRTAAASAREMEDHVLPGLNPFSLALSVIAFGVLCFVCSVAWSRMDRTSQLPQQAMADDDSNAIGVRARRRMLERLIGNNMPIIEEHAPLANRISYHGEEQGRRRLMLDGPHQLSGPHFAVNSRTIPPRDVVAQSVNSNVAFGVGAREAAHSAETPKTMTGVDRRIQRTDTHESEATPRDSNVDIRETSEHRPASKLLERVLVAMERERRK